MNIMLELCFHCYKVIETIEVIVTGISLFAAVISTNLRSKVIKNVGYERFSKMCCEVHCLDQVTSLIAANAEVSVFC